MPQPDQTHGRTQPDLKPDLKLNLTSNSTPGQEKFTYAWGGSVWAAGIFSPSDWQGIHLIWLLVLVACLLILFFLERRKRLLTRQDPDLLSNPLVLEHAMLLAVDQNATLRLARLGDELDAPRPLSCQFLSWEEQRLIVQLNHDQGLNHSLWTGFDVIGSFFVDLGGDKFFLQCECKVKRISQDQDLCLLALSAPTSLRLSNRRKNPRLIMDSESVLAIGVWPLLTDSGPDAPSPDSGWETLNRDSGVSFTPKAEQNPQPATFADTLPSEDSEVLPGQAVGLARPYLAYYPGLRHEAHLANLSASGLGLRLERGQACLLPEHCLLLLCLHSNGKRLCLWLACRRRHISVRRGRAYCVAGLDIKRWALYSGLERAIDWKRPDNNGAATPLRNWLVRHEARERKKMNKFVSI